MSKFYTVELEIHWFTCLFLPRWPMLQLHRLFAPSSWGWRIWWPGRADWSNSCERAEGQCVQGITWHFYSLEFIHLSPLAITGRYWEFLSISTGWKNFCIQNEKWGLVCVALPCLKIRYWRRGFGCRTQILRCMCKDWWRPILARVNVSGVR